MQKAQYRIDSKMFQLLTYLSCCLLIVAASTELPDNDYVSQEDYGTESSFMVFDTFTSHEPIDTTSEEDDLMTAHKINWLPLAQGQDSNVASERTARNVDNVHQPNEASTINRIVSSVSTTEKLMGAYIKIEEQGETVIRDGDACPSNAERGLTRLIRDARPLLPDERLRNILANAREDAEVRDLLKLLLSDQFKERVKRLRSTKEQGVLRDYVCQGLKLNHAYYIEYVKVFLNIYTSEPPRKPIPNRRKGVRGLLQDLRDALPRGQLRDLYRRQLTVDKELATAVRRVRSFEFRRLLSGVRVLPEYRAVVIELEKAGVPLQQVLNLVSNALGWGALDIGSETDILIV